MSDNILQTLQHLVQDVIAPDVRELRVRLDSLEKQLDVRFKSIDHQFNSLNEKVDTRFSAIDGRFRSLEEKMDTRFPAIEVRFRAFEDKMDAKFDALMSAITESRAQAELTNVRILAALSERVAVLEAQRH